MTKTAGGKVNRDDQGPAFLNQADTQGGIVHKWMRMKSHGSWDREMMSHEIHSFGATTGLLFVYLP